MGIVGVLSSQFVKCKALSSAVAVERADVVGLGAVRLQLLHVFEALHRIAFAVGSCWIGKASGPSPWFQASPGIF